MKRKLFILFVFLASAVGVKAQMAYAVLSEDGTTISFYYDNDKDLKEYAFYLDDGSGYPEWQKNGNSYNYYNDFTRYIESAIFDPSFAEARPTSTNHWFDGMELLKTIEGIEYLNTENVTDMSGMFARCYSLTSLDLSNFDTENVTDMSEMFHGCNVESLDLSNFDTRNVTDMSEMFYGCNVESLDLSSFDTRNVTDMSGMFAWCWLTYLDLSSFDTRNVTDMSEMFSYCENLTSLDLSNFDTRNVTNMSKMFYCIDTGYIGGITSSLTFLNLSNFDTTNVTDMSGMFAGCYLLTCLDLSSFDTRNVTDMNEMFYYCTGLTSLDLSNFDTKNVTDMSYMFHYCTELTSLDLSNFDTKNVTDMSEMFSGCTGLTSLDLSNFDTKNVTDMSYMFDGCFLLTCLDLSNFDTRNVTDMSYMFSYCEELTTLDLSNFDTRNVTDMSYMFSYCEELTSLDLSNFDTKNVTDMSYMFDGCHKLLSLDLSNFDTTNVTNMSEMFSGCGKLISLDLSNFDTRNVHWFNLSYLPSLTSLRISSSLGNYFNNNSFYGIGSETSPCLINQPDGFDFGVDTSGDYFVWNNGYFTLKDKSSDIINVTTDFGYITYCSDRTLDFTNVEGIKAYAVVDYDGNVTKLSRMSIVPFGTGMLLKADAGVYEVPHATGNKYVMNMLIGEVKSTWLSPWEGNKTNFVLANGYNGLGFYTLWESGYLAAHRAYLQVPSKSIDYGAKFIRIEFDDETTAIGDVTTQEENAQYYDLQGVRHQGKPTKQGIYIQNGKKVVVKD
ncbi:MAG: BspA family leucine-rich repeat surface protein [Prevotella sp.]|nr:BspA family leucine-rich repeat surface protein [Prevotella sp.]